MPSFCSITSRGLSSAGVGLRVGVRVAGFLDAARRVGAGLGSVVSPSSPPVLLVVLAVSEAFAAADLSAVAAGGLSEAFAEPFALLSVVLAGAGVFGGVFRGGGPGARG